MPRLRENRGPSPRYCAVCGGKIADMKPDSCVNGTAHISEVEMEYAPIQPKRTFKILARVRVRGRGRPMPYED